MPKNHTKMPLLTHFLQFLLYRFSCAVLNFNMVAIKWRFFFFFLFFSFHDSSLWRKSLGNVTFELQWSMASMHAISLFLFVSRIFFFKEKFWLGCDNNLTWPQTVTHKYFFGSKPLKRMTTLLSKIKKFDKKVFFYIILGLSLNLSQWKENMASFNLNFYLNYLVTLPWIFGSTLQWSCVYVHCGVRKSRVEAKH